MKKERVFWSGIVGFFVVSLLGVAAHEWYRLSGENPIVGFFAPTDESVLQHLKLLLFPYLLYVLGEYIWFGRRYQGFWRYRLIGLLCGLAVIPLVYYTYTMFTGSHILSVDILLFLFAVGLSFYLSTSKLMDKG